MEKLLKSYPWIPCCLLGFICVIGYFPVLFHPFLLDDYFVLWNETGVANKSFLQLFTSPQHLFYRPFGHVPLWVGSRLWGTHAVLYHLMGFVLFVGLAGLIYSMIKKISQQPILALLTVMLFVCHPFSNMLINNISGVVLLMQMGMLVISFNGIINYLKTENKMWYGLSMGAFVISLFSHEMSLMLPVYVFCLLYWIYRYSFWNAIKFLFPFLMLSVFFLIWRMIFFSLGGTGVVVEVAVKAFGPYLSSVMALLYWYMAMLFVPMNHLFLWSVVVEQVYDPFEIIRVTAIVLVLGYLLFTRSGKNLRTFSAVIFIGGLLPLFWVSYSHFPFAEPFIEPHWFYFGSIGFFILIAQGLINIQKRYPIAGVLLGVFIYLGLMVCLWQNNRQWATQKQYCQFWLTHNKTNATPFYGLGQVALSQGQGEVAIENFSEMIKRTSRYQVAFMMADYGYAYLLTGQRQKALEYIMTAIKLDPSYSVSYYYLANLHYSQGHDLEALHNLELAHKLYPRKILYQRALKNMQEGKRVVFEYPLFNVEQN